MVRWLEWLCKDVDDSALLFMGGTAKFSALFREVTTGLGLQNLGLSPGSLRACGATHLFNQGVEISVIRIQGRWRSAASLDHYIQIAAASLAMLDMSPCSSELVEELLLEARPLRRPPLLAWSAFFSRKRQLCSLLRRRHGRPSAVAPQVRQSVPRAAFKLLRGTAQGIQLPRLPSMAMLKK